MSDRPLCPLCETRPPRRACPAIHEDICAICCGREREQTLNCPLDCEYLREARRHEELPEIDPKRLPNPEIELTDRFMRENQDLAIVVGRLILACTLQVEGAVDLDVRDMFDALVRTYKTMESGLIYESRPTNTIAAAIQERFQSELAEFRDTVQKQSNVTIRDKDILGVLIFWQRLEYQRNNGRRKSRSFLESLYAILPAPNEMEQGGIEAGA
jgi:hypothetical protein